LPSYTRQILKTLRSEYYKLEDELRKKGFKNDTSSGAPICRWIFDGIKVDVMPANESIIGFSNQWYNKGLLSIVMKSLPDSNTIAVLSPAYYLASKFEAHYSRGGHDLRQSRDFADIVYVIENCESILEEISDSDNEVKVYLAASCGKLLRRDDLKEGIECVQSYSGSVDAEVIIDLINKIYASGE